MTEIPACPAKDLARLFTPEGKADPYPVYASFRDAGPVLRIGPDHLLVAGFDECSQALHDQRLLSTDATVQDLVQPGWSDHASWRWLTKNMLFSNEPQHDRFRRFFSGSLTARQVAAMRPMVERVVSRIVDGLRVLAGDEPVDLMTRVAYGVPMGVMGELLGIRPEAQMSFRDVIGRITLALEPIVDLAVLEPGDRAMDALAAFFTDLVDARRREPRDDLASRWVADRDRTELLSDEELVANLMLLLVAGTEAPMDLVGNTLKLALDHRSEAVDITTSPAAAVAFVQESLRYDPAVHLLNRVVGRPVTLWGHDLSRGDKVTLAIAAANRDPRCFEEPNRFWPARPDGKALTFSAGPHFCLGSFLARLQTETVVPALLGAFPGIEPAGPPTFRDQLVQRGFATLPVRLGTPSRARASLTADRHPAGTGGMMTDRPTTDRPTTDRPTTDPQPTTAVATDAALAARLGAFRSEHADVGDVRLHYVIGGTGKPLVLLPGWPETWWEYRKVMPRLARRFTVVAVDIRGMGGSSRPGRGYDKKTMAQDIAGLVRHLGHDQVCVAGHGIGAMVAFAFAATNPELVERLAIFNTTHVDDSYYDFPMLPRPGDRGPHRWWLAFNQVSGLPEQLLAGRARLLVDYMFGLSLVDPDAIAPEDREIYAHAYGTEEAIRASQGWFQAYQQDIADFNGYDKIQVPMLGLAYGTFFEYMAEVLPQQGVDVTVEEVLGTRNYLVEEQPAAVADALERFFPAE